MSGIYNYGRSPFSQYSYFDIPENMRAWYDEEPQYVFTNWLSEQGLNPTVRSAISGPLFEQLFADWYRRLHVERGKTPHFGEYLQGISGNHNDLNRQLAQFSLQRRGTDPRQFLGKARWMAF